MRKTISKWISNINLIKSKINSHRSTVRAQLRCSKVHQKILFMMARVMNFKVNLLK
jgi:hypothetical protein